MATFFARLLHALQKIRIAPPASSALGTAFGIGATIEGRYRLDAEIGRGGMGIVYRARDLPNDRDVALKIIDASAANDLTLAQFSREAAILSQLHHPHIVAVYQTGAVNSGTGKLLPFIVMELVQGTRLNEMRASTCATLVDIGKQICDALAYVHEQGFLYRDLKPGNVILEKRGFHYCVKLLDFGLARPRGEAALPAESSRAGTVFYLAPELITGSSASTSSDLYALGATLYEMITGRVPFADIDEQNILSQHLQAGVPPPSQSRDDLPPALEVIVLRLLEKNPEDRFAAARDVREALEQVECAHNYTGSGNLPHTHVDGRERDIAQVIRLLEVSQVVTLLNDDESLALAVGFQVSGQFRDGAWRVPLESVTDPANVPQSVASVLGVRERPDRSLTFALIESLREKNLLLLLSHCGHLPAACAQLVETILHACPEVYILATSPQPLNVSLENCYRAVDTTSSS